MKSETCVRSCTPYFRRSVGDEGTRDRGRGGPGVAYSGAADRDAARDSRQDLAARLREACQRRSEAAPRQSSEPDSARSLTERLREAAQGIDRETLAERAAELKRGREAEERQRVQETERLKERERHRDRGVDYGF